MFILLLELFTYTICICYQLPSNEIDSNKRCLESNFRGTWIVLQCCLLINFAFFASSSFICWTENKISSRIFNNFLITCFYMLITTDYYCMYAYDIHTCATTYLQFYNYIITTINYKYQHLSLHLQDPVLKSSINLKLKDLVLIQRPLWWMDASFGLLNLLYGPS